MKKNTARQKRIVVAGGAGFIGTHLIGRLLAEGHIVVSLDNLSTGRLQNSTSFKKEKSYSFLKHDITNPVTLSGKVDEVYNLACPASPIAYQKDPVFTMETCVVGTRNLLRFAEKKGARFLMASTSEVYGDPTEHPQKESYRGNVNPHGVRSCYDEGKRAPESLCMDFFRMYKVPVRIIRIFNTYGPYMHPDDGRVVSNFITQALKNKSITLYGDGNQTRSFQYVDDLVEGMVRMMRNPSFTGPVNIGNPEEYTVREFAGMIQKLIAGKSKIVMRSLPHDDPRQRRPDISLAKEKLGWTPQVPPSEGLQKTIEYFRVELGK